MKLSDFDYELPKELIAQFPLEDRTSCKMEVLNKENKTIEHKYFYEIINYLNEGDTLVLNDTKVIPARILGERKTGAKIEVFLLKPLANNHWSCLIKNSRRLKENEIIEISESLKIKIIKKDEVELLYEGDIYDILEKTGKTPLPPYIEREAEEKDKENYQTVFAKNLGSSAAPTAGLHFDKETLKKIEEKGIKIAYITLTVGLGTFLPVKTENVLEHKMHKESYEITKENAKIINETKGKIVAVGTTVVRTLEATYKKYGKIIDCVDETDIFIYPPYEFKVVDKLITNFHLPKSTLIMLVSAMVGKDFTFEAYKEAVDKKYRFFSYGDCMLIE
ncbi:MAG: tRNA preQ1(34) S-adenosylmethionine ribosyltransferase-isomerase QueA [Cyanobacteria bacterium SIG30]|nr:tRNA preQ1(34) S-adenosylmethionine ribosyltransferase-isomerase QueA [Cyanobacteria bacterium SIG30]